MNKIEEAIELSELPIGAVQFSISGKQHLLQILESPRDFLKSVGVSIGKGVKIEINVQTLEKPRLEKVASAKRHLATPLKLHCGWGWGAGGHSGKHFAVFLFFWCEW